MGEEKLSKADVLWAVDAAVSPFSAYIHDRIFQRHHRRISSGELPLHEFEAPTVSMVLRRLKALEHDGLIERSTKPLGNYGFKWSFTDAGRLAIQSGEKQ